MKRLLTSLIFIMSLLMTAAMAGQSADKVVNDATKAMLTRLKAESAQIKQNPMHVETIVKDVVLPVVDADSVSRRVLAKHYKNANAVQQKQFAAEFEAFLIRFYARAFANYDGEDIVFDGAPEIDARGNAVVKTNIVRKNNQVIPVAYRLSPVADSWKVYDVVVEGISLVQSKKEEFNPLIESKGLDQVITDLRKINDEAAK